MHQHFGAFRAIFTSPYPYPPPPQNVPPDLAICCFVLEQSLSVRALQEMLANTVEAGVEVRLPPGGMGGRDGWEDLGVIYRPLFFLSLPCPPQALNLDKWVGLALGVICSCYLS